MKNFLKIRNLATHSQPATRLNHWLMLLGCSLGLGAFNSHAHETPTPLPDESQHPRLTIGLASDGWWLSTAQALPSQTLRGYLLDGQSDDWRHWYLNHAAASVGVQLNPYLSIDGTAAWHGNRYHTEKLAVQLRLPPSVTNRGEWTLQMGRFHPNLGEVLNRAGHFDNFGLIPLGVRATTLDHWVDDGLQLSTKHNVAGYQLTTDFGLWRGQTFPGSRKARLAPSLHLGWGNQIWQIDTFASFFRPRYRGASVSVTNGGHTHSGLDCSQSLKELTCFTGRSTLLGGSVRWKIPTQPLRLQAGTLWRFEKGSLESTDGLGQYTGRTGGSWVDGIWLINPQWESGLRYEYLTSQQTLVGQGAAMVATQAGLNQYRSGQRLSAMIGWSPLSHVKIHLEGGVEKFEKKQKFIMLRAQLFWDKSFDF